MHSARRSQKFRFSPPIPHGLPQALYPFREGADGYLAFVGRISPEKRVDSAMRVARDAGLSLRIAAKVDPVDRTYFESEIRPLLESMRLFGWRTQDAFSFPKVAWKRC